MPVQSLACHGRLAQVIQMTDKDRIDGHPGQWLALYGMSDHIVTLYELAERIGATRQALSNLLNGKAALTADMAIRLERALGVSAAKMMEAQANHSLSVAREKNPHDEIERIPEPTPEQWDDWANSKAQDAQRGIPKDVRMAYAVSRPKSSAIAAKREQARKRLEDESETGATS